MKPHCSTHLSFEIHKTTHLLTIKYTFRYTGDFEWLSGARPWLTPIHCCSVAVEVFNWNTVEINRQEFLWHLRKN